MRERRNELREGIDAVCCVRGECVDVYERDTGEYSENGQVVRVRADCQGSMVRWK